MNTLDFSGSLGYGPRKPSSIPALAPLPLGTTAYGSLDRHRDPDDGDCRRAGDHTLVRRNGKLRYNQVITSGAWWLLTGDRPLVSMTVNPGLGAYASPAILPGLGVGGRLRAAVRIGGELRWLDRFDTVETRYTPGETVWICSDAALGLTVELHVAPFVEPFGFSATMRLVGAAEAEVEAVWAFGRIGWRIASFYEQDLAHRSFERIGQDDDAVTIDGRQARLTSDAYPYTEVYAALTDEVFTVRTEPAVLLDDDAESGRAGSTAEHAAVLDGDAESNRAGSTAEQCVVLTSAPAADAGAVADAGAGVGTGALNSRSSRFVCVWGYRGYDRAEVEKAYKRLEHRPFADSAWLEDMKENWFHHWVGRGLCPAERFGAVLANPASAIQAAEAFWNKQRTRLKISTPDPDFDTVVNRTAAELRMQYEYPGILHGLLFSKYGKINCGYYGFEAAGLHEETAASLKFISGTQCVKGRQRYFMPAFTISPWAEEVNFYYVEQVWHHYRWTGDLQFLKTMWPSVRRALEHALTDSDPDGDGIMTGYYEMWNCDSIARGGLSALHTGMGWAALRAAVEMAGLMNDIDVDADRSHTISARSRQGPFPFAYAERYRLLLDKVEAQFAARLWNRDTGAWCSGEWNGDLRPMPASHEQNYHIWRGLGDPKRNYTAMRYIRDKLHTRLDSGHTVEMQNVWWPIMWSHHYTANGDTCASVASACAAGDIDHYWPLLKSVADTAYTGPNMALYQMTGSHTQEIETMFIHAVVDGLFGIKPDFGANRIVVRPSLPSHWDTAQMESVDVSCDYRRSGREIRLRVRMPANRLVRAELLVKSAVKSVRVNGVEAEYALEPAVNGCRVAIEAQAADNCEFVVETCGTVPKVVGNTCIVAGSQAVFRVSSAQVRQVHDPQGKLRELNIRRNAERDAGSGGAGDVGSEVAGDVWDKAEGEVAGDVWGKAEDDAGSGAAGGYEIALVVEEVGACTLFVELQCGDVVWWFPLELDVRKPWYLTQSYASLLREGGAGVTMPYYDRRDGWLHLQVANEGERDLTGMAEIIVAGSRRFERELAIPAGAAASLSLYVGSDRQGLSPGRIPLALTLDGRTETAEAVDWAVGEASEALVGSGLQQLDLAPLYTANLRKLYSPDFAWRLDYTGCGVGVDWREPMPEKDRLGYALYSPPIAQFEYGVLPEQWYCTGYWDAPELERVMETPPGVAFMTAGPGEGNNVVALACTQPYEQLPSRAALALAKPVRLSKIYLLTANLTKSLKCYYPGGEIVIRYEDGQEQLFPLVPPYTMSNMIQSFSPTACSIPFGSIANGCHVLTYGENPKQAYLAVSDIVPDSAGLVKEIEFRCTATETLFAILGISVLPA